MRGKIYWFQPDFKLIADGAPVKTYWSALTKIELTEDKIYLEFSSENEFYELNLKKETNKYSGRIICAKEDYGITVLKKLENESEIMLDGDWNTTVEGNFRCLVEINKEG